MLNIAGHITDEFQCFSSDFSFWTLLFSLGNLRFRRRD